MNQVFHSFNEVYVANGGTPSSGMSVFNDDVEIGTRVSGNRGVGTVLDLYSYRGIPYAFVGWDDTWERDEIPTNVLQVLHEPKVPKWKVQRLKDAD